MRVVSARSRARLLLVFVLLCVSVGLGGVRSPAVARAVTGNLLVNGSFELGTNPGDSFSTLQSGSTAIAGWTVTRVSIDYIGGLWQASLGGRSLDLDGSPGPGGIAQRFTTMPGRSYQVTFDLAGNPGGPPAVKRLGVRAAGQQAGFTFNSTGRSYNAMGWTRRAWTFKATGKTTTLEFYSLDTAGGSCGPTLDNVSVMLLG